MMKPILEIQNISKQFRIQHEKQAYLSIRDSITGLFNRSEKSTEDFFALRDVSFNVEPGESVGIIGKNGAGKSTLLKILSKITPPSSGKIISRGRIASLLEVGTGFHPELTGRENIFLNGSILGMKRGEIIKRYDEIVDFSGVEKFLDTPLKHYSSGMQLRLAFSVAAFLEPEILVIDEVLAVGDAEFQKKCMGKMDDVSKSGRTILFVSHNMSSLQSLCTKGIVLRNGRTEGLTTMAAAVRNYLYEDNASAAGHEIYDSKPDARKKAQILETKITDAEGRVTNNLKTYQDIYVEITWRNNTGTAVNASIELHNYSGKAIMWAADTTIDWSGNNKKEQAVFKSRVKIPANWLKADEYFIRPGLYCSSPMELLDIKTQGVHFSLIDPFDDNCIARGNFKETFEHFTHLTALEWESSKTNS
jgi:lipopolysaccharide transport system ATP-binding protein